MYMYNSKKFVVGIIIGVAFIGFALYTVYQATVVAPREKAENAIRAAEKEAAMREAKYNLCLSSAYADYSLNWDRQCELLGKEKDCSLPLASASIYDDVLSKEKDRCVTLYK